MKYLKLVLVMFMLAGCATNPLVANTSVTLKCSPANGIDATYSSGKEQDEFNATLGSNCTGSISTKRAFTQDAAINAMAAMQLEMAKQWSQFLSTVGPLLQKAAVVGAGS